MNNISKPKKKRWPLILLGMMVIGAIGSQIECTIEVPNCGGFYWNSTSRRNRKYRNGFCRCK